MKKIGLLFCISILTFNIVYCQGHLYTSGQSGFHLAGQIGTAEGSTLIGISPGYTANGKFTFGISLGLEDYNDLDLSSTAIRPYLAYLVVKQGDNDVPINVSIGAAYQYNTFKDIDDFTANTISLNSTISHIIAPSKSFKVIPLGGIGWNRTKFDIYGYEENQSLLNFGIGASLVFNQFFFTPLIGFSDGNSNFNLLLGMTFPQ